MELPKLSVSPNNDALNLYCSPISSDHMLHGRNAHSLSPFTGKEQGNLTTRGGRGERRESIVQAVQDVIRSHSSMFIVSNQQHIKDKGIKKDEICSVIIQKQSLDEESQIKREYYQRVEEIRKKAQKYFKGKMYRECFECLEEGIRMFTFSYDFEFLHLFLHLRAAISQFFGEHRAALADYKRLRVVARELENMQLKLEVYELMGECYKDMHLYENQLKCYKKALQLAWNLGDKVSELKMYESLGVAYYYLGYMEKSKYYNDRFTRGKSEKRDSTIRKIYTEGDEEQRERKSCQGKAVYKNLTFKKYKLMLDKFDHIENQLHRALKKRIIANVYGVGDLKNQQDFYLNGLVQNKSCFNLNGKDSPITNISLGDLPSPKIITEGGRMKNAELLPYLDENDSDQLLTQRQVYELKAIRFKGQEKTGNLFNIGEQYDYPEHNLADIQTKASSYFGMKKDNSVIQKFREERERLSKPPKKVELNKIIQDAKRRADQNKHKVSYINLNHLSPSRNYHQLEKEEKKSQRTLQEFSQIENKSKELLVMNESEVVNFKDMSDEQATQLISERRPVFKSNRYFILPRFSQMNPTSSVSQSSFTKSVAFNMASQAGVAKSSINVLLQAQLRNPNNQRLKKLSEQMSQALTYRVGMMLKGGRGAGKSQSGRTGGPVSISPMSERKSVIMVQKDRSERKES